MAFGQSNPNFGFKNCVKYDSQPTSPMSKTILILSLKNNCSYTTQKPRMPRFLEVCKNRMLALKISNV